MYKTKESTMTDQRRDLIFYALERANNGNWFYTAKQIVTILQKTYMGDLIYAETTIIKKVGEVRKGIAI